MVMMGKDGVTKKMKIHWKTQTMQTLTSDIEKGTHSSGWASLIWKESIKGLHKQAKITSEMPKEQNEI